MTKTDAPERIWTTAEPKEKPVVVSEYHALCSFPDAVEYTRSDLVAAKDYTIAKLVEHLGWIKMSIGGATSDDDLAILDHVNAALAAASMPEIKERLNVL